jgi:pyruvate/2-oxoglutarate dehydrogenase complex dihydrolipoamide acyltransferase (E2) component
MPFWYYLPVPQFEDPQPATVRIAEWVLEIGAEVHSGTRIVVIEVPSGQYAISASGDGVLRKRLFPAGAEIESFAPIAVIAADGEHIPCGKPYSSAECLPLPENTRPMDEHP